MTLRETLLHLSLIDRVGPAILQRIVASELLSEIYSLNKRELCARAKISEAQADLIIFGLRDTSLLSKELALIKKYKARWLTILDTDYPEILKNIHLPPTILYIQGPEINFTDNQVAIVGSRNADDYGYNIVKDFVPALVAANLTIVSGGALGIDTMAHSATVQSNGITVAVLGSGLVNPYPASNRKLFQKIIESGGNIVSPFGMQTSALPGNFPARNRIIAGLSKACVVIQAAQKSGALITAQFALNEGREVCAVPGPITNPLSAGCHKIISEGAHLVTSAADILIACGASPAPVKLVQAAIPADSESERIRKLCMRPVSFDEILAATEINSTDLQQTLLDLQFDGVISQNLAGQFVAV